jgi:hypothetical protein
MPKSVRLSIVEQALSDIVARLAEMPDATPRVAELRHKATAFDVVVRTWIERPPTETARAAMLKSVLDLSVEVMDAGRTKKPSGTED